LLVQARVKRLICDNPGDVGAGVSDLRINGDDPDRTRGRSRESLYKEHSGDRIPSFDRILRVIAALCVKLSASVKEKVEGA
jgi:hypothetical protein